MGALALRAPENVVRAQSGKEIDIWAIGCMVRVHVGVVEWVTYSL